MSTVLITGASRGLGLEFVRQYAGEGWIIAAACRDPAKATQLQALAAAHKNVRVEALDVADAESIAALAVKLRDTAIDLLINNAGIFSGNDNMPTADHKDSGQVFGSIDTASWTKVLQTNTMAPIKMLEAFLPHVLRSEMKKVANVTSRMGSIAQMGPGYIAYRTSKAALNAAMATISLDLGGKKIAWVNLHPGWVKTDMGGKNAEITPETSIAGMRKVIARLTLKNSGRFLGYDGKALSW